MAQELWGFWLLNYSAAEGERTLFTNDVDC